MQATVSSEMNTANYDWVDVYQRVADKLLDFKRDRAALISIIKQVFEETGLRRPALSADRNNITDICPFSFLALFNKGLTDENRKTLLSAFIKHFGLNLPCPDSFDGIPVLTPQKATFYWFTGRGEHDIDNLWEMYEVALQFADSPTTENRAKFCRLYDICQTQKGVKWNLSIGFYWMRPLQYLNLDGKNRRYIETSYEFPSHLSEQVREKRHIVPNAEEYLQITTDAIKHIQKGHLPYSNLVELSYHAWIKSEATNKEKKQTKKQSPVLVYEWVDVYHDIAEALNTYRNNRKELIEVVKASYEAAGLKLPTLEKPGNLIEDIGPFTVFGLFNKQMSDAKNDEFIQKLSDRNRRLFLNSFMQQLGIQHSCPENLSSIPVLNSANALFYKYIGIRGSQDIENLWDMFDAAITYADYPNEHNKAVFIASFDKCQRQKGVKWNLTTALYWIRPYSYLSLSSTNRKYIETSGIFSSSISSLIADSKMLALKAENYLELLAAIKQEIATNKNLPYSDFIGLTDYAYNGIQQRIALEELDIKQLSIVEGKYLVDIDITKEEWLEMLLDDDVFYQGALQMVLEWYKRPGHAASTKEIMSITHPDYKGTPYNGVVTALGQRIVKYLNRFTVVDSEGKATYWCIPFEGWHGDNGNFIWKLRSELAEAIAELDLEEDAETASLTAEEESFESPCVEAYSVDDFLHEVFISAEKYQELRSKLLHKKNIILQGAPGVGKTFISKRLAWSIMGEKNHNRVMMIQFHQSYGYEDFIMGYRPSKDGFELKTGPFYNFCKKATEDTVHPYFFIIDEINRGNLSKIFGELFMLMESDKRGESLSLLYTGEQFSIPENLHIIGMMNTADRSLAMLDYALRRRFAFFELAPAFESEGFRNFTKGANNPKFSKLLNTVTLLNEEIERDESLGRGFRIGHSYFYTTDAVTDEWLHSVVHYELIPLLEEYWFDSQETLETWRLSLLNSIQ